MGLLGDDQDGGLFGSFGEYLRRSSRNLARIPGDTVDWLAGGAQVGAEPVMALYRGDDLDQPLFPTWESGGKSRLGAAASGIMGHTIPAVAPEGALGTFAGRMAATANKAKMNQAVRLENRGVPMEDIRQRTGWGRGPDGEWKWEISDHKAEIRLDKNGNEILHHPELRRAYPDLMGDLKIKRVDMPPGGLGRYDPKDNTIYISKLIHSPHEVLSIVLHEMQHPIQITEGFSTGAAMGMAPIQRITTTEGDAMRAMHQQRLNDYFAEQKKWIDTYASRPKYKNWNVHRLIDEFEKENPDLAERAATSSDVLNWMDTPDGIQKRLFDTYERAMGEYEARETQRRMDYTPDQRRANAPYDHTGNIPQNRLIDMRLFPGENGVPFQTLPELVQRRFPGLLTPEAAGTGLSLLALPLASKRAE